MIFTYSMLAVLTVHGCSPFSLACDNWDLNLIVLQYYYDFFCFCCSFYVRNTVGT